MMQCAETGGRSPLWVFGDEPADLGIVVSGPVVRCCRKHIRLRRTVNSPQQVVRYHRVLYQSDHESTV